MTDKDATFYQWSTADGRYSLTTITPAASMLLCFNASKTLSAATGDVAVALANTLLNALSFTEIPTPATPGTNGFILYAKDNGAGKTQLIVMFNDGSEQVIKTEV